MYLGHQTSKTASLFQGEFLNLSILINSIDVICQAHDHAIKCVCMNINETLFCTGSADGDIKIWDLNSHRIVHTYQGEHARHGLFKNISQGVAQVR